MTIKELVNGVGGQDNPYKATGYCVLQPIQFVSGIMRLPTLILMMTLSLLYVRTTIRD